MSTIVRTLTALGAALGLILGGATVAATTDSHASWAQDSEVITTGGVVRFYSDGPAVHENAQHAASGIRSVHISDRGHLVITQTYALPVVTVIAQSDETLVKRGISAGISGGVSDSHVAFYDSRLGRELDLTDPADYRRVVGPYANLWFSVTQVQR